MRVQLGLLAHALGAVTALTVPARRETIEEAAVIARSLVDLSPTSIATMATVLPEDDAQLPGQPFPLQEYYASCHANGSLTLLFLPISRHSRNLLASPTHAASLSFWSEPRPDASRPRVSLLGNVTVFTSLDQVEDVDELKTCYLDAHPDAEDWTPDAEDAPHVAYWARFDPQQVYFVGGFGDAHYIGPIPLALYRAASGLASGSAGRSQPQITDLRTFSLVAPSALTPDPSVLDLSVSGQHAKHDGMLAGIMNRLLVQRFL